jgi:drug/metabolite transporter (DMT)-like permease
MQSFPIAPHSFVGTNLLVLAGPSLWAILAGLFSAATWAFGSHLFSRALGRHRDLAPAAANLFKNASTAALYALVMLAMGWVWPSAQAPWLLLSGLFGFAIGDALYFAAFPRCGVQLAALSANLVPPLAALLGYLVRGTRLELWGWLGMLITLMGIALVVTDRRARGNAVPDVAPEVRRVGLLFAGLAAVSQALSIVAGARGFEGLRLDAAGLIPGTVVRLVGGAGGAVLLGLLASLRRRAPDSAAPLSSLVAPLRSRTLILALLIPSAMAAWINLPMHSLALAKLPEGVSSILFALTPVFTLPIGLALGARYGERTVIGTLFAFAGVAIVILYGQPPE